MFASLSAAGVELKLIPEVVGCVTFVGWELPKRLLAGLSAAGAELKFIPEVVGWVTGWELPKKFVAGLSAARVEPKLIPGVVGCAVLEPNGNWGAAGLSCGAPKPKGEDAAARVVCCPNPPNAGLSGTGPDPKLMPGLGGAGCVALKEKGFANDLSCAGKMPAFVPLKIEPVKGLEF